MLLWVGSTTGTRYLTEASLVHGVKSRFDFGGLRFKLGQIPHC